MPYTDPVKFRAMRERQNAARRAKTAAKKMPNKFKGTREAKFGAKAPRAAEYLAKTPTPPVHNEDAYLDSCDYRNSPEFKAFQTKLEKVLQKSKKRLRISDLNRLMGKDFRYDWVRDALEVSPCIERDDSNYFDLFYYKPAVREAKPVTWALTGPASKTFPSLGLEF